MRRCLITIVICIIALSIVAQARQQTARHVVRPGETLNGLAQRYLGDSSRWPEIYALNPGLENPNVLRPGQEIIVPLDVRAGSAVVSDLAKRVEKKPVPRPWVPAERGDKLREKDGIRTFSESSARLTFEDGADLILSEDSLVFLQAIERRRSGRGRDVIEIIDGQADIRTASPKRDVSEIEVVIGSTTIRPSPAGGRLETRGRVTESKTAQVMSYSGETAVEAAGESVQVEEGMGTFVEEGKKPAPPEKLLPAPGIISPAAGERPEQIELQWSPVDGAVSYTVEVCHDPSCVGLEYRVTGIEAVTHSVDGLLVGPWHWRITARASSGLDGYPSPAVPFTKTASIHGRLLEDPNGDGSIDDGRPLEGELRLLFDGGSEHPDDGEDREVSRTRAGSNGDWTFADLDRPGLYWVVASSRSLRSSSVAETAWLEQTHGVAGSLCIEEGESFVRSSAGPCFGGRRTYVSDDASDADGAEHVTGIVVTTSGRTGVDFGFSPSVVVHDGDAERSGVSPAQGSLRQFVMNANAGAGSSMRFVPVVPLTAEDGEHRWWVIRLRSSLPAVSRSGIVLDGRAWSSSGEEIESNPGLLGSTVSVGLDEVLLERPSAPELIVLGRDEDEHAVRLETTSTVRDMAIAGGFSTIVVAGGDITLENLVLGVDPDGSVSEDPTEIGLRVTGGRAAVKRVLVSGQKRFGLFAEPSGGSLDLDHVEIASAGLDHVSGDAVALQSSGSVIRHTYIHDCASAGGRLDRGSGVEIWGPLEGEPVRSNQIESSTISRCARGILIGSRAERNRINRVRISEVEHMSVRIYAPSREAFPTANDILSSALDSSAVPIMLEMPPRMIRPSCQGRSPSITAPAPELEELEWSSGTMTLRGRTCEGFRVEPYLERDGSWWPLPEVKPGADGVFVVTVEGVGPLQRIGAIAISPDRGTSLMSVRAQ